MVRPGSVLKVGQLVGPVSGLQHAVQMEVQKVMLQFTVALSFQNMNESKLDRK